MFKSSPFDKTLETATSHLKLEPDWASIMIICDLLRQNDVTAKHAIGQVKKKMLSSNPHTALYALMVLESLVKNCGAPTHEEITNRANCEAFAELVRTTTHENVRNKMLELIQTWSHVFRTAYKYRGIKDTMNILKTEGYKFPEMKEAINDKLFASDVAPDWADGDVCHRCRTQFSIVNRKHHCRNCGQVFCGQCSGKTSILPRYGIEKEVRVCDGCYDQLQKPVTATAAATPSASTKKDDDDLPVEYLTSSLAQQNQQPVRKTEEELREEEELQLALALSQSEIESKKQSSYMRRTYPKSPSPEPVRRSPSPEPEIPELARYLNRDYWEQRQAAETTSPSAPSPMPSSIISLNNIQKSSSDQDIEIDDFVATMRTQVEIFVNRMKSNSSRGRSISNDTSVQSLFMNITSMHSRLLTYIKEMDDKRQWHEQLQDKLAQVKDSRAALDVLRQEHIEKMRRIAEEQERQRQMQMAYKLEVMRKKKQEYLQYQRQLALQRIQEQEREMAMRQEQQKAQYMMGGNVPFGSYIPPPGTQGSPMHAPNPQQQYPGQQFQGANFGNPAMGYGQMNQMQPQVNQQGFAPPNNVIAPNPQSAFMPINPAQNTQMQIPQPGMMNPQGMPQQQHQGNQQPTHQMTMPQQQQQSMTMPPGSQLPPQQMQIPPGMMPIQNYSQAQPNPMPSQNSMQMPIQQPVAVAPQQQNPLPAPPQNPPAPKEPETAELISFD